MLVILTTVFVLGGTAPEINFHRVPTMAVCRQMRDAFLTSALLDNAGSEPAFQNVAQASCKQYFTGRQSHA